MLVTIYRIKGRLLRVEARPEGSTDVDSRALVKHQSQHMPVLVEMHETQELEYENAQYPASNDHQQSGPDHLARWCHARVDNYDFP